MSKLVVAVVMVFAAMASFVVGYRVGEKHESDHVEEACVFYEAYVSIDGIAVACVFVGNTEGRKQWPLR